jgi:hypothetical protein
MMVITWLFYRIHTTLSARTVSVSVLLAAYSDMPYTGQILYIMLTYLPE